MFHVTKFSLSSLQVAQKRFAYVVPVFLLVTGGRWPIPSLQKSEIRSGGQLATARNCPLLTTEMQMKSVSVQEAEKMDRKQ